MGVPIRLRDELMISGLDAPVHASAVASSALLSSSIFAGLHRGFYILTRGRLVGVGISRFLTAKENSGCLNGL